MYIIYFGHEREKLEIHMEQLILPFECFGVFVVGHTGKLESYDESCPRAKISGEIFILMLLKHYANKTFSAVT
jgi:hypothetical protein